MDEFVIQSLLFTPIVQFVIKPHRPWNRIHRHFGSLISFVLVIAVTIYFTIKNITHPNLFKVLNAKPWFDDAQLRQCYLKASLKLHPDRNNAEDAVSQFETMKSSYEILKHPNQRRMYNRFGDILVQIYTKMEEEPYDRFKEYEKLPFGQVIYITLVQCLITTLFSYAYTFGKSNRDVRKLAVIYSLFVYALEFYLRFDIHSDDFLINLPFINTFTTYEKILMLRRSISLILNIMLIAHDYRLDSKIKSFVHRRLEIYLDLIDQIDLAISNKYRNLHGINPPWASVLFPSDMNVVPWPHKDNTILEGGAFNNDSGPNWARTEGNLLRRLLDKIKID